MIVFGKALPKLKQTKEGIIYLPDARHDHSKAEYKIRQKNTIYDDMIALVDLLSGTEEDPFLILRIETPALAYVVRHGIYTPETISRTKARQLARFTKKLFASLYVNYFHSGYMKETELKGGLLYSV